MGLCKCPKRQVTNQFCFEHRVNVCEYCMVQNHPKCIVQSYLRWLRDSDYISNCTLCSIGLDEGECVRLICYHVFHWDCLNARQSALPVNTAPHGHQCPTCETEIFPNPNLVSPVADALKQLLSTSNWGRNGLGLALLNNDYIKTTITTVAITTTSSSNNNKIVTPTTAAISSMTKIHHNNHNNNSNNNNAEQRSIVNGTTVNKHNNPHSVLLMDAFNPPSTTDVHASSRRPLLARQSPIGGTDRDDNKYARRTPAEILSRWSRRFYTPSFRPPWRRTWFLICCGVIIFVIIIYLMAALSRINVNDTLDEAAWNNPNPQPRQNIHYD